MSILELSVIIVNYNGVSFLRECFDSLKENLKDVSFEIIVVDNDSKDDSCLFIKQAYPEVVLIESKENLGFGRANNLGVTYAKGETILLLNNDTIIQNQLFPAIQTLHAKPENGIVTIKMLDSKKQYISGVGRFPTPLRLLKISFLDDMRKEFKTGEFNSDLFHVDWVCGAFMLIRKSDYERVVGFDSDYFMYIEDVDLCKKITNIGKKCIFQSNLSYIHFVGFNKSREDLLLKGYQIYASKHFSKLGGFIANKMILINRIVKKIKNR